MTIEQFRQICDDWKQSGLSVQQYCENTGLTESRFDYYKSNMQALSMSIGGFTDNIMIDSKQGYNKKY